MEKCPQCGFALNGDESVCPNCGYVLKSDGIASPPPPPTSSGNTEKNDRPLIPFADSSKGFVDRFLETVKLVIFSPRQFFSNYNFKSNIGMGILFAVIVGFISAVLNLVYQLVFNTSIYSIIARFGNIPVKDLQFQNAIGVFGGALSLIFVPIGIVIALFITSGIYHLLLMMVNGANEGFEDTFNVVAYTSAATLFAIVPFCGNVFGVIYRIILNIMGLATVQKTSTGKASFAVLLPYALCCLCIVFYLVVILGVIGIAAANAH